MTKLIRIEAVADIKENEAIHKSLEFFLGRVLDINRIQSYREEHASLSRLEIIKKFLEEHGMYLLPSAIEKKFIEHYIGKEWNGYISQSVLRAPIPSGSKLFALMSPSEADYLGKKFGVKVICGESIEEGKKKAQRMSLTFTESL